jgi:F420-0:gamma-glutamyl ligase
MEIKSIKTSVFKKDQDLFSFVTRYISRVREGDIIVITSKIVALAEGRTIEAWNEKIKERSIKEESEFALKTKYVWRTQA